MAIHVMRQRHRATAHHHPGRARRTPASLRQGCSIAARDDLPAHASLCLSRAHPKDDTWILDAGGWTDSARW